MRRDYLCSVCDVYFTDLLLFIVSNDVAKAVKEQRKLLTVNQLKRQNSQETWDRKIRFPNLNSEQLLREGTTAGREDMAIEGFRKEGAPSPSPEELDARLHKQAVALYDNKSNTLPRTLTGDKVTAIQQPFSAGVSLRSAPPTPMTPQLTMTATEVDRTARFNGAVTDRRPSLSKMTGEELRKKTLAVVSRQFSSNFEDAVENKSFHALPETQMSLQDIYLSQIRARTTMDNIIGERNGSFVSIAEDNERDILKMIKQKSKGAQSGTNTDGGIQRLDSDKLERQSTFSIEKPPLRFDEDLLDASAVQIAPMAGAPPPKPEVSVKMMLPRSGTSIGAGFFGKKRAEEFTNSKRKVSEVEYSDTDSDDSDGSSNNSHGQRKPFGMSLTPFGQAVGRGSKAPFFSDDISVPGRVEENVADTSRTPPSPISKPDRPVTAPAKKSNRQTDVSKIDNIIASIEEVQQGVATSYGPNRLRKSLNDAISISSGASNNEILFFNNRKPIETAQRYEVISVT